jgi:tripartite-type tricarboxylate transporter receptor subunit TctC
MCNRLGSRAFAKLPYDPERDLVPIAIASENALAIAVSANLGVGSLGELAQLARSRPGKLTWAATPGGPYFAFAAFDKSSGADMARASYRDFNQALIDLREGRIDAVAASVAPLLPYVRAGKIKLLAFVNQRRAPIAPDVPTAAEAGYPDVTVSAVTGFFGWRDMPTDLRRTNWRGYSRRRCGSCGRRSVGEDRLNRTRQHTSRVCSRHRRGARKICSHREDDRI